MRAKTGIWLIGACGNVGMLTIVGARAMARGLAGATGLVTELTEFHALDLARVDDLVFGGHEVGGVGLMDAARAFARRAGVLSDRMLEQLEADIDAVQAEIRPGIGCAPVRAIGSPQRNETPAEAIRRAQEDLRSFQKRHDLESVVVVNVS